eukprot:747659-Hanusia_phi.AAC.2
MSGGSRKRSAGGESSTEQKERDGDRKELSHQSPSSILTSCSFLLSTRQSCFHLTWSIRQLRLSDNILTLGRTPLALLLWFLRLFLP